MMLAGLLFLLSLTGGIASNCSVIPHLSCYRQSNSSFEEKGEYSNCNCTRRDVLRYLNLTKNNENSMTQPGGKGQTTNVALDVQYTAILDVDEKDQKFVSSLWISMWWKDQNLSWDPRQICCIMGIPVSSELVWKPDITIEEMIKMENSLQDYHVWVDCDGSIFYRRRMVVTSTCKMEVYQFPFDVQSCSLSFQSIVHPVSDLTLEVMTDTKWTKNLTKEIMRTGSEWLYVNLTTENKTADNFGFDRSMLVYTITMKRRSVLYIANFLLPVLFFFCLDLASFLISDSSGEKLSFKVTVLLAVTVMQLILNEILPSTSDRVPLVAVYCIGMFGLMMISLFETILVIYLMEKDIEADEPKREDCEDKLSKVSFCSSSKELKKWTPCACVCDVSADEPPSELLSATKEVNISKLTEESIALEKVSDDLKEVIQLLNNKEEAGKFGYWTRVAKTINKVFVIMYVTVAVVFLVVLFSLWHS